MSGLQQPPYGGGYSGVPGFNGNIQVVQNHGFRAWQYKASGKITGLAFDQVEWTPGVNRAIHWNWKGDGECPFPNISCSHGFYAYYDEDYFSPNTYNAAARINGVIDGFGRCVIGEKGYRAEYAVIVAFCRPFQVTEKLCTLRDMEPELVEKAIVADLERRFPTAPVFDSIDELRKVIPLAGRPPRNDQVSE